MSHTTTIDTVEINDIKALKKAVKDLQKDGIKCRFEEKRRPRMYYEDQHGVCDHVLVLEDGPYDVGFDKRGDHYVPVYDDHCRRVSKHLGNKGEDHSAEIGKLLQHYVKHATIHAAQKQGYTVQGVRTDAQGNMHVVVGRM